MLAFSRCLALLALLTLPVPVARAQEEGKAEAAPQRESLEIKPYTGPPIFLPEGEAPPEPVEVTSRVVKEPFPGTQTTRFERGVVKFSDDTIVSNGINKEYYSSGQLYAEGSFRLGTAVGEWTYYHPNGEVAKKVTYADGKPDGGVTVLNDQGKVIAKRTYAKGLRDGVWETYSQDGEQKLREDHYSGGKANGIFKVWFSNGQLRREVPFVDGKQEGVAKEWTSTGEKRAEVSFRGGLKDGPTKIWQSDGKVVEQTYEAGKLAPKG